MTLTITIALVTAAVAAASGCTVCVEYEASKFEVDCHERGGRVRTSSSSHQWCIVDGGAGAALERDDDGGD